MTEYSAFFNVGRDYGHNWIGVLCTKKICIARVFAILMAISGNYLCYRNTAILPEEGKQMQ